MWDEAVSSSMAFKSQHFEELESAYVPGNDAVARIRNLVEENGSSAYLLYQQ